MAAGAIKFSISLIDGMFISAVSSFRHSSRTHAVSKGHQIETEQSCSALYPFLRTAFREVAFRVLPIENMKQRLTELRRSYQAYQRPQTHGRGQRDVRFGHSNRASGTVEICRTGWLCGKEGAREAQFPLRTADHGLHQSGTRRPQAQASHSLVRMSSDKSLIRRVLIVTTV